ncbi:hypothetical protein ABBQ38_005148 [Trebouxia sp. C0009 RCD-2024]
MQLTPLSRLQAWPQPSGVATMPPAPSLPRLNKPAAVLAPSAPDSTCDIHRLLESYSRQITQTEGQISCICQTQQQVVQVHMPGSQYMRGQDIVMLRGCEGAPERLSSSWTG